jgi:hypothetical protein
MNNPDKYFVADDDTDMVHIYIGLGPADLNTELENTGQ